MWNAVKHSPELIIIRLCCRYALGQMAASDCVPYLESSLDETRLLAMLHEERVLLLVYQVLSGDLKPHVSPKLIKILSQKSKVILTQQLALMVTQRDVQKAFQTAEIPYIFLKGPVLNQMLWGRRMMRYSGDLDVLVAPKDIFRANTVLKQLSFKTNLSEKKLRFHLFFHQCSTKKDVIYWHGEQSQLIELHWKSYCSEFIFKRNNTWEHGIDDEAYILYLCLHAARHGWSRLIWLVDIIAFITSKNIDILRLRELATASHITPVVDEAILLAEQWLGMCLLPHGDLDNLDGLDKLSQRNQLLQKRVMWARKTDLDDTLWTQLSKRFLMNAFCSNAYHQIRLWIQITLGAVIMKLSKSK
jgi:hypothetical protein